MKVNGRLGAILLAVGMAAGVQVSFAQAASPDVYSQDDLMGMEKTLAPKADASGLATEPLKKYATDYTLLTFRNQTGKAELHEKFADFYFVIDGKAKLV